MSLLGFRLSPMRFYALYGCIVALAFLWGGVGAALAAPAVLVTVRSVDNSDPAPFELRLRSELAAEGIAAVVVNAMSNPGDAKQLAARFGANAVVEVTVSSAEVSTSIWATEPAQGLEVTRSLRVSTKERDVVGISALRTVDFLQGARIELEQQRQSKIASGSASGAVVGGNTESVAGGATEHGTGQAKPTDARKSSTQADSAASKSPRVVPPRSHSMSRLSRKDQGAAAQRDHFRVGVGYSLLWSSDEFPWSSAPWLSITWFAHPRWAIGVSGNGPFLNHIQGSSGQFSITVDQELVWLHGRYRAPLSDSLDLEPHVGIGVARYTANGKATSPNLVADHAKSLSGFTQAGCTLAWRIGGHFRVLSEVMGFGRWENPYVKIDDTGITGSSRWNLVVEAGAGWAF